MAKPVPKDLLIEMTRESDLLRQQSLKNVNSGMKKLTKLSKTIAKLRLDEDESLVLARAYSRMMNSGVALRVMVNIHNHHHQRNETPWSDVSNSLGHVQSNSLAFERNARQFCEHIEACLKEQREQGRRQPAHTPSFEAVNPGPSDYPDETPTL